MDKPLWRRQARCWGHHLTPHRSPRATRSFGFSVAKPWRSFSGATARWSRSPWARYRPLRAVVEVVLQISTEPAGGDAGEQDGADEKSRDLRQKATPRR
jgi:hypothetical protein